MRLSPGLSFVAVSETPLFGFAVVTELLLMGLALSVVAVAVHRIILFGDRRPGQYFAFPFGMTELRYVAMGALTFLFIVAIIAFFALGIYALIDQQLYREHAQDDPASQGLVGFFRVAGAPADRNLTQFGIDGGVVYKGLIPGRDWDTLGLAGSYLEMSDDLGTVYKAVGLPKPDYEAVIELSYKAQHTAWWTLQPSFQYVFHPGGRTDPTRPPVDNSVAIILQTSLRF